MLWFRLVVTVAGFAVGVFVSLWMQTRFPFDFMTFWLSAQHWWAPYDPQWIAPYEQLHEGIKLPFAYPPVLLLFIYPFGLLPLKIAFCLWSGLWLALFSFLATFVARAAAPFLLLSPPILLSTALGQTGLLVASAMVSGMLLLERRPRLAGVLLGLAACLKPQAMLAAPIVLWGRWHVVKTAIVTCICLILLSFVFGTGRWIEWLSAVHDFQRWLPYLRLVTPTGLFDNLAWKVAVGALGIWFALRRDLLGLVAGTLCFSPYAQSYDLAPLVLIGAAWMARWREVGVPPALLGASMVFSPYQSPLTILLILLAAFAMLKCWRPLTRPGALAVV